MSFEFLNTWLAEQGLSPTQTEVAVVIIKILALLILASIVNFIAKRIVLRVVRRVVEHTDVKWDDVYLEERVFDRLSHLAPALVIHAAAPSQFGDYPALVQAIQAGALIYMVVVGIWTADGFLKASSIIYDRTNRARQMPITAFVQVAKFGLYLMGTVFVLSQLLGKSPLVFFSGLGAFTAVLLLIFKDSILGLVAGVQLSANNMVARGDWIEMPKYGADGDVLEVSLTTVKVQNWDKTISTIPTYALISDSFKNWRGMSESGGRRIKRSLLIDLRSIKFCDEEMLGRFRRFEILREYLDAKVDDVATHNASTGVDTTELINGRRLTNIGTFRAYIEAYLRSQPKIHRDMTFLVRQLPPSDRGLPLEIYVFSNDQVWANYEALQADIFDHLLAAVPLFDLQLYQSPSGEDLARLSARG